MPETRILWASDYLKEKNILESALPRKGDKWWAWKDYSLHPCRLPKARFAHEKSFHTIFSNLRPADYEARLASLKTHWCRAV
jgi:hypothetical protein